MTYRKKLIEVALPLDAINAESAREKSIRHSHPSTLHLWWARRPLASCRAVIFASLVDDPSAHPDQFPTEEKQSAERERLFEIIRQLVKWENSNNQMVLDAAKAEIVRSTGGNLPMLLDPFCGGGSIPLEAQRLGLEVQATDLNPVAVLINKALIEIPPKFAGHPPVNRESLARVGGDGGWTGAHGLAEDVRYYGRWLRDEARRQVGHLYPKVSLPKEYGGGEATVIAWLWTRTVTCPNPACGACMPLARSFWLSTRASKKAWVEPMVDRATRTVRFEVRTGQGEPPEGTVNRRGATCVVCATPVPFDHVRTEGKSGRMGTQLMAVVAEAQRGRIYLSPTTEQETVATQARPEWQPDADLPHNPRDFKTPNYGMRSFADLFTARQLVTLTTFSNLAGSMREQVRHDALTFGLLDDGIPLAEGGTGATAYADAIATYLALAVSKVTDYNSTLVVWSQGRDQAKGTFARQALPMVWDYAEINPFAKAAGDLVVTLEGTADVVARSQRFVIPGTAFQEDASTSSLGVGVCISTDPPYYDNIGYADLSDFFYIWLRKSLQNVFPSLFGTLLVPKAQELVATPYRFEGDKAKAEAHFEAGLSKAFSHMREAQSPDYPLTVYYAFKQAESDDEGEEELNGSPVVASTGWETMLEGLLHAGFNITGTWPMRTERGARNIGISANALASSIVLVCRPRPVDAPRTARRDFLNALRREMPGALKQLQQGNIAPVDLAQATIGPGMAIFSRYSRVVEADGSPMRVRTALQLINQTLDEVLAEQEGEFDADTRWAIAWFEQFGTGEGLYGIAETLSKAKNTTVSGLAEAGLVTARAGKVRLLSRAEMPAEWDPSTDRRLTVWEAAQHLIRALDLRGEQGAATLLVNMPTMSEVTRDLAYRLFTLCERKGWAQEATAYNSLVTAWQQVGQLAQELTAARPYQPTLPTMGRGDE
jgi:putative DNA methylase